MRGDLRKDFVDRQYKDFVKITGNVPFASEGKSVFYAGDKEKNQDRASSYAKKNGMSPIYRTVGGEFLNRIDTYRTFGKERFRKLWG